MLHLIAKVRLLLCVYISFYLRFVHFIQKMDVGGEFDELIA